MITIEQVKKCDPDGVFDDYRIMDSDITLSNNNGYYIVHKNGYIKHIFSIINPAEFEVISRVRELIMKEG